jgi:type IV pilus assembly protein PilE
MHASKREFTVYEHSHFMPRTRARPARGGFTLIEVMVTVAIVAILAAIALPNYFEYLKRSRITEATTGLSDARQRAEQGFLDTRDYSAVCATAAAAAATALKFFTIACNPAPTVSTYTLRADGTGSMTGFTYTVDNTGAKASTGPAGWAAGVGCWAIRKDGSCS